MRVTGPVRMFVIIRYFRLIHNFKPCTIASIATNFEIDSFKQKLEQQNINYSESKNPGTSYCNLVYWNSLNYIKEKKLDCKFLFIHIPFEKNISDISKLQKKLNILIKNL